MICKLGRFTLVTLLAAAVAPSLSAAVWKLDPSHSAAQFAVRHLMVSTVRGQFEKISGTVNYDPANPEAASVNIEVEVASIDTRNAKRDDHLRSADFFDVANHPVMKFESTRVRKAGDGKLKLTGNLTIRGVTREVTFDVDGPAPPVKVRDGQRSGATATAVISRKDFGITWNRAIEAGGVTVSNEVHITIDVEMISSE